MFDGSGKIPPGKGLKVEEFVMDDFSGSPAGPAEIKTQAALKEAGFQDFSPPGRAPAGPDGPSLDYLFEIFDPGPPGPARQFVPQTGALPARKYIYADLDTRDPQVARTLEEAQTAAAQLRRKAQKEALAMGVRAEAEAGEIRAQARREAETIVDQARLTAQTLTGRAEEDRRQAADLLAQAQAEKQTALEESRTAQELLTQAQEKMAQAEDHLGQARQEGLAQGQAEGLSAGREQGLREGREEGRRQAISQLGGLLRGVSLLYDDLYKVNEPLMIKLALEAASLVVNRQLEDDSRPVVLAAFKTALGFLNQAHRAEFAVNPADLPALEEARAWGGSLMNLNFIADPSLSPGDLVMRSNMGRLDATVKNRLQAVLKPLELVFRNQPPPALAAAVGQSPSDSLLPEDEPGPLEAEIQNTGLSGETPENSPIPATSAPAEPAASHPDSPVKRPVYPPD